VKAGRPTDAVEVVDVVDVADPRWMSPRSERHGERGRRNSGSRSFCYDLQLYCSAQKTVRK
jgi:hypothetical protein